MKALVLAALFTVSLPVLAVTQQDVEFAQRQCQQRQEPDKCRVAREMARTYQREQRDRLEYDAAVRAGRPMQGAVNVDININNDGRGGYRWNHSRGKYCYHNSSGSVNRCVN